MTAPVVHETGVEQDGHIGADEAWRGVCSCGWKSSRYLRRDNAVFLATGHEAVVRDGQWNGGVSA